MRLSIVALQSKIDELGVALAEATAAAARPDGNATFDTVTCKKWKVVDDSGKERMSASTFADGRASMDWFDKDEVMRISARTTAVGAGITWFDKDGKSRIGASTKTDGTVTLPTTDLKPKP